MGVGAFPSLRFSKRSGLSGGLRMLGTLMARELPSRERGPADGGGLGLRPHRPGTDRCGGISISISAYAHGLDLSHQHRWSSRATSRPARHRSCGQKWLACFTPFLTPPNAYSPHRCSSRRPSSVTSCSIAAAPLTGFGERLLDANRIIGRTRSPPSSAVSSPKNYRGNLHTDIENMHLPNPLSGDNGYRTPGYNQSL
jgi:hypothetical protein